MVVNKITFRKPFGRLMVLATCVGFFFTQITVTMSYQIPQHYLNRARSEATEARKSLQGSQEWKKREEDRSKNRWYGYFGVPTCAGIVAAAACCYSGEYECAVGSIFGGVSIGALLSLEDYKNKNKTSNAELDLEAVRILSTNAIKSKDTELNKARSMVKDTIKNFYCRPGRFVTATETYTESTITRKSLFDPDPKHEETEISKNIWEYGVSPHDKYKTDLAFGIAETASKDAWNTDFREELSYSLLWDNSNLSHLAKESVTTL